MDVPHVHHVTLTVTDAHVSADWYRQLLGPAQVIFREGPGWVRWRMQWPGGLVIGVTQHETTAGSDTFAHDRVGLDHLGLGCRSRAEVEQWAAHIDAIGATRGPIEDAPYGWAVTVRDPDNIPVEFFCGK